MADRPARPEAGPSGDEVEITPDMAEAGRAAYYAVPRYRGDEPMSDEIAAVIYQAMRRLERSRA